MSKRGPILNAIEQHKLLKNTLGTTVHVPSAMVRGGQLPPKRCAPPEPWFCCRPTWHRHYTGTKKKTSSCINCIPIGISLQGEFNFGDVLSRRSIEMVARSPNCLMRFTGCSIDTSMNSLVTGLLESPYKLLSDTVL